MLGRRRPPASPTAPSPDRGEPRNLVGVKLMQEPGFAANDSHLYRRQVQTPGGGLPCIGRASGPQLLRLPSGEIVAATCIASSRDNGNTPDRVGTPGSVTHISGSRLPTLRSPHQESTQRHRSTASSKDSSYRRRRGTSSGYHPNEEDRLGTDFRSAIGRIVPSVPQVLLKTLGTREVPVLGKVRVSLRVSPSISLTKGENSILSLDKKRRQVTLIEPRSTHTQDRVGVSAPKIFAFDQVYSREDEQSTIVEKVVPDILQAVLAGNDGCVLCFGGSGMGKTHTMVGSHASAVELGVMPCALSWLYQSIAHLKTANAARFSVRVSAVAVDASGSVITDVLREFAQETETSPGALLRQGSGGFLSSVTELRAPSPETAARYLDLALSARSFHNTNKRHGSPEASTLLFSLYVYQYTVDKSEKGRVVGGRSKLHLIDLGDMSGYYSGSLSLSGLTSVLLAIFNGQKYLPHKDNKLTHLLQETLGSITCHAAMIVHVSPSQRHSQHTLATLQLASRVHKLRRKKIRGLNSSGSGGSSEGSRRRSSGGETSAGSSSIDFSSSEQSADTVIYIGGGGPGDSTDGEHPPIFFQHHIRRHRSVELPRLRSLEQLRPHTASPVPIVSKRPTSVSPTPTSRSVPSGRSKIKPKPPPRQNSIRSLPTSNSFSGSPNQSGFFRHQPGVSHVVYPCSNQGSKESLLSSFKPLERDSCSVGSPVSEADRQLSYKYYQEPNTMVPVFQSPPVPIVTSCNGQQYPQVYYLQNQYQVSTSAMSQQQNFVENQIPRPVFKKQTIRKENVKQPTKLLSSEGPVSDEQWIDGPRIPKSRITAASKNKNCRSETWVDGPSATKMPPGGYGFMDDHKKTMIERWVEIQTAQVVSNVDEPKVPTKEPNGRSLEGSGVTDMKSNRLGEDLTIESDVDTLSEDHSAALTSTEEKQPNLIEELERKNFIPVPSANTENSSREKDALDNPVIRIERSSPEASHGDEPSMEDICSQCEALAEECEELNSLLSCEEEECKRQIHQGLATVMEEPELESVFGADDLIDSVSLLNNPQTDCEDAEITETSELENVERDDIQETFMHGSKENKMMVMHSIDSCVQVCEEDILRTLSNTPCPSDVTVETSDDHPLRVLSEENLTCASTFTDSYSQLGETGDEDDSDEDSRPFSLFETTEYGKICQDLNAALQSESANRNLRELGNIHHLFSTFTQSKPLEQPESLFTPRNVMIPVDNRNQTESLPNRIYSLDKMEDVCNDKTINLETNSCNECNNKRRSEDQLDSILNLKSVWYPPLQKRDKVINNSSDKCTSTEDYLKLENKLICDSEKDLSHNIPHHYYHPNLGLYDTSGTPRYEENNYNTLSAINSTTILETKCSKQSKSNNEVLPTYIKDIEENVLVFDPVSFSCKPCEDDFERCDIHKGEVDTYDNDSDCPSSVSEDSEYIMQNSKLSKFLCVGIGKSKSKNSIKTNKLNSKQSENKKNIFKIRDCKSKSYNKSKDMSKSPDHNSKNLIRSPSRILLQSNSKEEFNRIENDASRLRKKNLPPPTESNPTETNREFKCSCVGKVHSSSPPEGYDRRLEFSRRMQGSLSSVGANAKEWNVPDQTIPCLSPQTCPEVPSSSSTKSIPHPMTTSGSLGTTQSLGESSGYESIPRDSECSSFSSSQESEMDEEHRREAIKFSSQIHNLQKAGISASPVRSKSSLEKEVDRFEERFKWQECNRGQSQISFLKQLTKKSVTNPEGKLVSSTTWKYQS